MDDPKDSGSTEVEGVSPTVVLLHHPSGSKIYVVGTANFSAKAPVEVAETIDRLHPVSVVIEMDEERMQQLLASVEEGGGLPPPPKVPQSPLALVRLTAHGEMPRLVSELSGSLGQSLLGTLANGEFVSAARAAQEVGARLVLAGRPASLSWHRVQAAVAERQALEQRRGQADMARMRRLMDQGPGAKPGTQADLDVGQPPDFMTSDAGGPLEQPVERGLGSDTGQAEHRIRAFMDKAGCIQPNEVLAAAKRLLEAAAVDKGPLSSGDLLTVRRCSRSVVEKLRVDAAAGDATDLQALALETVTGGGQVPRQRWLPDCVHRVLVEEQDVILARRLWEAGEQAAGQAVVGVLGAAHLPGITRIWSAAGSAAIEARARDYCADPVAVANLGSFPGLVLGVVTLGGLGLLAYRRPRVTAYLAGGLLVLSAPGIVFSMVSLNRFSTLVNRLHAAAKVLEGSGYDTQFDMGPGAEGDWEG